ncbi:hypothetical protein V493_06674 [Pseudogymnoascus sp. VKM F-4281 (FW-2241)]|nr:hypothetical protein V493_06674 [Pseudogymnoascus sp. VKM F-4281 (FW-2241)]
MASIVTFTSRSLLAAAAVSLAAASLASAAGNMVPDYEVKLLMDPTVVLGSDFKLKSEVLSAFAMPTAVTKMNVQFLDDEEQTIYSAGWSPRIRKKEGESDYDLTYKKRYAVSGDDIDGALTLANSEGFDAETSKYEAQIEWGYQKKTLSLSNDKTVPGPSGMDLPNVGDSQAMLIDEAPDKFIDWTSDNWGTTELKTARIYGPVLAKRSTGFWSGIKLYVEVWPIRAASGSGIDYIVEASFKTDTRSDASTKHGQLMDLLQDKGWFLAQDSLKTHLIMERY